MSPNLVYLIDAMADKSANKFFFIDKQILKKSNADKSANKKLKKVLIDKQILKKSMADKSANKKMQKGPIDKQILKKKKNLWRT